jgi:hypothetical protein
MNEDRESLNGWKPIFGMQKDFRWKINGGSRYLTRAETKLVELFTD